ncbi:MAG TPA: hypothetical protein VGF13_20680 [Verrucomicrobiae bacterium]
MLERVSDREIQPYRPRHPRRSSFRPAKVAGKGLSWIPWQAVLSRVARGYGFIDPVTVLRRLRAFAKPSEVGEPIELLRAGVVFHARGLINTRAIQFNLDWVWPYWVEQQFNPNSESFIPRAFSFSHINLTHRNWTAVGLPDVPHYSIVDPRGLVTPLFDGWSLDFWLAGSSAPLLSSKCDRAGQSLEIGENISVRTRVGDAGRAIDSEVSMERDEHGVWCVVRLRATCAEREHMVVALRPYNPEGVSFIDSVKLAHDRRAWMINEHDTVQFSRSPEKCAMSCYDSGDVFHAPQEAGESFAARCAVGMATAAAMFSTDAPVEIRVPVQLSEAKPKVISSPKPRSWRDELNTCARIQVPDERLQRLYDAAVSTVILHTPGEVFPGPYTYRRFWYRDAALILNSLVTLGAKERTWRALELFPRGQLPDGYFRSQEGEWDSNGQVLWIFDRYFALTGESAPRELNDVIERGARWILQKRMPRNSVHPGLLPAGFSAEHLGPNDFYYWDDFWGAAGLQSAARLLRATNPRLANDFELAAADFMRAIQASIETAAARTHGAIPAAPDRRMDSGAVGSLVADFPLQLFPPGDPRVMATVEWLAANSFARGGFFQNMIHSGINAYLTLHIAQVMLRAGDQRVHALIDAVAQLASPTGQWPEAIHPRTLGGCMGDGQHVWAAAEWLMMMRNLFVREEGDALIIGSGIRTEWLTHGQPIFLEGTLTPFGEVSVRFEATSEAEISLTIQASWRGQVPRLEIQVPEYTARAISDCQFQLRPCGCR